MLKIHGAPESFFCDHYFLMFMAFPYLVAAEEFFAFVKPIFYLIGTIESDVCHDVISLYLSGNLSQLSSKLV